MKKLVCLLALALLNTIATADTIEESLESVSSRGQEQRFILTRPAGAPTAALLLFAGGHGKLSLGSMFGKPTIGWGRDNNLVRTRKDYAESGFVVATLDAPSDLDKMNAVWRMGPDHAEDIAAVATFLRQQADVPLWAVGTSMGSFSAVNAALSLGDQVHGLVLTSAVTRSKRKWKIYADYPNGVIDMEIAAFGGPVMVVNHEQDGCGLTPAVDIDRLGDAFSSSVEVGKAVFSGGDTPRSDPCSALSYHGYLGIEQQVVDAIAAFIKAN